MVVLSFTNWYHSVDCRAHCLPVPVRPRPASPPAPSPPYQQFSFLHFSVTQVRRIGIRSPLNGTPTYSADHTFFGFRRTSCLPPPRSCSLDSTPRPQRSPQACPSLSNCFSLPFLPWLGYRPLRPVLEAQRHRSRHLVRQDTLPLLCQWPGLRRWSRPRRRKRKRLQNPPKRIKSRAAKDGR